MSKKQPDHKEGGREEAKLQSPKGMRDLIGEEYYRYQGFFEKAAEVAIYYGFQPIETPMLESEALFYHGVGEHTDIIEKELYSLRTKGGDRLALRPEGTAPIMRAYFEHGLQSQPQPIMLYYHGPFFRHDNPQKGRYREFYQFGLEVLGSGKSITDALIIRLVNTILTEAGLPNLTVEINSIGDRDCRPIWKRELVNYYRKHVKEICADCRERLKDNPLRLLDCKQAKCQTLKAEAPSIISYLCTPCKQHFKEVLECLESMKITYTINNNLVRGLDYYSRTVFEISITFPESNGVSATPNGTSTAIAGGGRYDYLAKFLGSKKPVPAVGAAIGVDRVLAAPGIANLLPRLIKKPKIFFIQLGTEAKMKSLSVIEILRRSKVPIAHSLSKDSLSTQLGIAEKTNIPYAMILGQKEVIDNTVIIRDMRTHSQDVVDLTKLAEHLKSLKS
ncbi:MAG TPA: histidine--tRNA ligase [Candidatus Paceibacterota bacterium]